MFDDLMDLLLKINLEEVTTSVTQENIKIKIIDSDLGIEAFDFFQSYPGGIILHLAILFINYSVCYYLEELSLFYCTLTLTGFYYFDNHLSKNRFLFGQKIVTSYYDKVNFFLIDWGLTDKFRGIDL